jgi:hypothetical protein
VYIDRVITFVDFEVIEIVVDSCPYPAPLGIDWAFNNYTVVDLNKRSMNFERDGLRVIAPLDCNDPKPNSFLESLTTTNLLSY